MKVSIQDMMAEEYVRALKFLFSDVLPQDQLGLVSTAKFLADGGYRVSLIITPDGFGGFRVNWKAELL